MNPFQAHINTAAQVGRRTFARVLFLDLETRSELDLTKIDAESYARHPSTEVMCARWAIDDQNIEHWDEDYFMGLLEACPAIADPETLLVVHNAEFEPRIFRHVLDTIVEPERIMDSAAVARAAGLPGGLDNLAQFFGGAKDAEGRRAMLKLCKPRKPSKANPDIFWRPDTKPEDFALCYTYCGWDVYWMREAMRYMPALSPRELAIYHATYRMNALGFPIDRTAAQTLHAIVIKTRAAMSAATKAEFGFTLTQVKDIAEFLGTPGVAKNVLRDFLKDPNLDPDKRRVALARQIFAKTSVDKIKTMLARSGNRESNLYDGETAGAVHDGVIYGGAERTLRFSGSGVQPQNFTRGMGEKQHLVFDAIEVDGCFEIVFGGEELPVISDVIRGLIKHPTRLLNVGDYSQIEARLLSWMVGDTALLTVFRAGGDPYKMMAGKIYHKAVEDVTGAERFMGKQTVLGCGYGLGGGGFMGMLDVTYDVQIEREEADTIVAAYRKNAPKVRKFWKRLDQALLHASANVGTEFSIIKDKLSIKFTRDDRFWLKLPSGRLLRYYDVKKEQTRRGYNWSCYGRLKNGGGYGRVKIYGGALTGHIIQATAREVIAEAMVALDGLGHDLVLTVHDELVSLDDDNYEEFERVMNTPPVWLTDFPLAVDAFQTERYRK